MAGEWLTMKLALASVLSVMADFWAMARTVAVSGVADDGAHGGAGERDLDGIGESAAIGGDRWGGRNRQRIDRQRSGLTGDGLVGDIVDDDRELGVVVRQNGCRSGIAGGRGARDDGTIFVPLITQR